MQISFPVSEKEQYFLCHIKFPFEERHRQIHVRNHCGEPHENLKFHSSDHVNVNEFAYG